MMIHFWQTKGKYGCFSNFSAHPVDLDGQRWPTVEHYFQAMKFPDDPNRQERIRLASTPLEAKRIAWEDSRGMREDWDSVRDSIMERALRQKFRQHKEIAGVLKGTGVEQLVEHTRYDAYWGDGGDGTGENRLGKLLMRVRKDLIEANDDDR